MRVCLDLYSEKAREGAVSALKQGFGCSDIGSSDSTMYGITGSFRKLEVDWLSRVIHNNKLHNQCLPYR